MLVRVTLTCAVWVIVEVISLVVVFQSLGFAVSVIVTSWTEVGSPQVATGILDFEIKDWHSRVLFAGSRLQEPLGSLQAGSPGSGRPFGIAKADAARARIATNDFILGK